MIHLNKLLRMSSIVLVISMAAVFGSVLFQLNFNFSLSFGYLSGLLLSGGLSLIDVSSIDLIYVLKVFALALFTFASAMVVLKAFQRKHFLCRIYNAFNTWTHCWIDLNKHESFLSWISKSRSEWSILRTFNKRD